ncbi:CorA family divalent cation transporter [Pseudoxanthomonas putridarboris]|uniref:CorA family divalent cation transporter n=1 Tax=Pseudoxanthomonas putridarboris TaxID=752605 RepID=A0ABU9J288_9GAMM
MPLLVDTHETPSFSGMPGVLWAYRFDATGHAEAVDAESIAFDPLLASCPSPGWLWLHLNLSDARSAQLVARLPLDEDARGTLLSHDTHVSLQLDDEAAHGVLVDWPHQRGVDLGMETGLRGDDGLGWVHFALTPRLLVTARRQALRSVETTRRQVGAGTRMASPVRLLEAVVDHFADVVERTTDGLAERLDRIEDRVLADSIGEERRDLALLRHQAVRLHRPLTAMRRVLKQFEQRHPADEHELLPAVSRLTQRFDDLDGDVSTLQERARLLQDEVAAKLAERTNRHLYVLSMITALLLPPSLVVGVFGMNLQGLPFERSAHGVALALMLGGASSLAVYLVLRRMGVARST